MHSDGSLTFSLFAVLVVRVYHVVHTPSFKLLRYFYNYICSFMVVDMGLSCKPITAYFVFKFPNVSYHGNRSRLSSLTDTIQLTDPENPVVRASILDVSSTQA